MRSVLRRGATKALLLALAMLATLIPAAPARAAWAQQLPLTLQIMHYYSSGGSTQLGLVTGTVQFDDGGTALQYSLTFCRQSSYAVPYMTINVNSFTAGGRKYGTYITTVYPDYTGYSSTPPCYSTTGTAFGQFTYADFWNVEFIAYGSTFEGQSYVVESQDRIYSNPY